MHVAQNWAENGFPPSDPCFHSKALPDAPGCLVVPSGPYLPESGLPLKEMLVSPSKVRGGWNEQQHVYTLLLLPFWLKSLLLPIAGHPRSIKTPRTSRARELVKERGAFHIFGTPSCPCAAVPSYGYYTSLFILALFD